MNIISPRQITFRLATTEDLQKLANLIHFEAKVHRHLDWRPPLDWVEHQPYLVAEREGKLVAALACPPDPPNVAWIRLFAVASDVSAEEAWKELWPAAQAKLNEYAGPIYVAAIPMKNWFLDLLERSDFSLTHKVVVLTWSGAEMPSANLSPTASLRSMNLDDLLAVESVDAAAFGMVWQNSLSCLEIAFRQAAIATVVDISGEIVGYQISTATALGGHLARLAVKPKYQGMGIGYALLRDMLTQFKRRGATSVSVNTQEDNLVSLSLYKKANFKTSGEIYPVYQYKAGQD